jgi:3'-5' exonuclease
MLAFRRVSKATLHELCSVMGLPGKPDGIHGGDVETYFHEGRIKEIANYCESDVVNTYRVWLRYELFRGKLTSAGYQASEANLTNGLRVAPMRFRRASSIKSRQRSSCPLYL